MNECRMIASERPDGMKILVCSCGHRSFVDPGSKAVCPQCGAVTLPAANAKKVRTK